MVDLITGKAFVFDAQDLGATYSIEDIPAELQEQFDSLRLEMLEAVAEEDETLLDKYVSGEELSRRISFPPFGPPPYPSASAPCCAARRSGTKGCSRFWTRLSTIFPPRWK